VNWLLAALVVLAIGAVAVVASGRGGGYPAPERDRRRAEAVAEVPLTADGLREVRFTLALRGYRADEVDALLRRLAAELESRPAVQQPSAADADEAP
jgi:DivIVA domain-containing protein